MMTAAWLIVAALLEVGGVAAMRVGLRGQAWAYLLGAGLLSAYGLLVNQPALGFGRLLGLYIAVFFVVSQALAWAIFGERPGWGLIAGGSLIVAGGLVIQLTSR
jgi:small multidrug resistance family-3 protein